MSKWENFWWSSFGLNGGCRYGMWASGFKASLLYPLHLSHFQESPKKRDNRNFPIGKSTVIPWIKSEPQFMSHHMFLPTTKHDQLSASASHTGIPSYTSSPLVPLSFNTSLTHTLKWHIIHYEEQSFITWYLFRQHPQTCILSFQLS